MSFPRAEEKFARVRAKHELGRYRAVILHIAYRSGSTYISITFPVLIFNIYYECFFRSGKHSYIPELDSPVGAAGHQLAVGLGVDPDDAVDRVIVSLARGDVTLRPRVPPTDGPSMTSSGRLEPILGIELEAGDAAAAGQSVTVFGRVAHVEDEAILTFYI